MLSRRHADERFEGSVVATEHVLVDEPVDAVDAPSGQVLPHRPRAPVDEAGSRNSSRSHNG